MNTDRKVFHCKLCGTPTLQPKPDTVCPRCYAWHKKYVALKCPNCEAWRLVLRTLTDLRGLRNLGYKVCIKTNRLTIIKMMPKDCEECGGETLGHA